MPVTTPARTLLDLADVLTPAAYQRSLERAEHHRLDAGGLPPRHGRRGAATIRDIAPVRAQMTRSGGEDALLDLLHAAGLPRPEVNAEVEGYECDLVWREKKVIVELDSWTFHKTRAAFRADRARDRALQLEGWLVLRFPAEDLEQAIPTIRAALATR